MLFHRKTCLPENPISGNLRQTDDRFRGSMERQRRKTAKHNRRTGELDSDSSVRYGQCCHAPDAIRHFHRFVTRIARPAPLHGPWRLGIPRAIARGGLASRTPARTPWRVPRSCPVAVGRDVPIAPPRHCPWRLATAVRGLASSTR